MIIILTIVVNNFSTNYTTIIQWSIEVYEKQKKINEKLETFPRKILRQGKKFPYQPTIQTYK